MLLNRVPCVYSIRGAAWINLGLVNQKTSMVGHYREVANQTQIYSGCGAYWERLGLYALTNKFRSLSGGAFLMAAGQAGKYSFCVGVPGIIRYYFV